MGGGCHSETLPDFVSRCDYVVRVDGGGGV